MRRIRITATAVATLAMASMIMPASGNAMARYCAALASASGEPNGRTPIEKVGCWGVGWHGPGWYPSLLGLRAACWGPLVYGAPAYVAPPVVYAPAAPVYAVPPPATWYFCDNPQGYYPNVATCPGGWRTVASAQ